MSDDITDDALTTRVGLADDLLLLLFAPDSGTIAGEGTLFYVLAGAVLTDLTIEGYATSDDMGMRGTLVRAVGDHAPDDPLLSDAWQYIAEKPRSAQTVLAAIGPRLREPVLDRLVAHGDIRRTRGKALGFIPTEKLEDGGTGRRDGLLAAVRATLVDGATPDGRTAALAALLSASGQLPTLHRDIPWTSPVIARAKQLEQGDWGADAAAAAVTRTMTATVINALVVVQAVAPRG